METNLKVTKSNDLIEASYHLRLDEQRLILACIAKINSTQPVPSTITLNVDEFTELYPVDTKNAYKQMKDALEGLFNREIKIKNKDEGYEDHIRWITKWRDGYKQGIVTLQFHEDVKPLLGSLKGRFTSYKLDQVRGFRSGYSIRIFELIHQHRTFGERKIPIAQLKRDLAVENKYKRFTDFRKRILDVATEEINKITDYTVDYDLIKRGRTIEHIVFRFEQKAQTTLF